MSAKIIDILTGESYTVCSANECKDSTDRAAYERSCKSGEPAVCDFTRCEPI